MGAADDLATTADLATATKKERQFQVVPVPGHFTRGRWKCWDYKDDKNPQVDEKLDAAVEVSTIIITATTTPEIQPLTQDAISALETTPIKEKESSTIVVTSIAPHPPSIHGTPSSLPEAVEMEQMVINSQLSHTIPEATTVTGQQHIVVGTNDILIQQVSVGVVPQPPSPPLPSVASAPGMVGRPDGTPTGDESENGGSAEQKLPNIDNKIEQAMDLVKTHLTFAVREEIEVLRQTIHELEQKVSNIEQENQLLRQFAPAHIVADLPQMLALQRQTNAQAAASRAPAVPAPTSAPKIAPEGFCSTSFANTLNNVVADVRQQIRSIPPAPRDPQ